MYSTTYVHEHMCCYIIECLTDDITLHLLSLLFLGFRAMPLLLSGKDVLRFFSRIFSQTFRRLTCFIAPVDNFL